MGAEPRVRIEICLAANPNGHLGMKMLVVRQNLVRLMWVLDSCDKHSNLCHKSELVLLELQKDKEKKKLLYCRWVLPY